MARDSRLLIKPSTKAISKGIASAPAGNGGCLRERVRDCIETYFQHLDGHMVNDLYLRVIAECEKPLLEVVMQHSQGNLSQASRILGINRNTLKRKLQQHGLN